MEITLIAYSIYIFDNLLREFMRTERRGVRKAGNFDRKSSIFVAAYPIVILLLPIALFSLNADIPQAAQWIGIAIMTVGLGVHISAQKTLGRFYTGTLHLKDEHILVKNGLYKYVRNPGYLGVLILSTGFGLASGKSFILGILLILYFAIYAYRINAEEKMMHIHFGKRYEDYKRNTKKLLPFIF